MRFCWGSPSRFIYSHSLECALLEAGCPVCSIPESLAHSKRLLLTPQLQAPRVVGQDKVLMMSWDHSVPGTFANLGCSALSPPLSRVHLIMIMETRIYSVLPECQTSTWQVLSHEILLTTQWAGYYFYLPVLQTRKTEAQRVQTTCQ